MPELRLEPAESVNQDICRVVDDKRHRPARLVAVVPVLIVPGLACQYSIRMDGQQLADPALPFPKNRPLSYPLSVTLVPPNNHAADLDKTLATLNPLDRNVDDIQVLEVGWIAVRQPVRDVGTPDQLSVDGDVAVQQVRRVHDLVDVEFLVRQDDGAVDPTQLKRLQDRRRVVHWLSAMGQTLRENGAFGAIVNNEGRRRGDKASWRKPSRILALVQTHLPCMTAAPVV